MMLNNKIVVIDNGSLMSKAGWNDDELPRYVLPSAVQNNYGASFDGSYALDRGTIINWNDMERLWNHIFADQLRCNPMNHRILLTESILTEKVKREKTAEVMFERFQCPALFLSTHAILSLYSTGRTTGLVLDSGDGTSQIVPVWDGYAIPFACKRLPLAGQDLTAFLTRLLMEQNISIEKVQEVRAIKDKLCHLKTQTTQDNPPQENFTNTSLSLDFDSCSISSSSLSTTSTYSSTSSKSYELPDGKVIQISEELLHKCPEALFNPSLINSHIDGLHVAISKTIGQCDISTQEIFTQNIILSGGTTLLPGLTTRLEKMITNQLKEESNFNKTKELPACRVLDPPHRRYAPWIGGAILASLSSFHDLCVSKNQFEEHGPNIIHKKCI